MTDATIPAPAPVNFNELQNLEVVISHFILQLGPTLQGGFNIAKLVSLISTLASDPAVTAMISDFKDLGPELKGLTLAEGMSLGIALLTGVPSFIAAFKAPAA